MCVVLGDFNFFIAQKVRTLDCSLWAPGLVLHNLLQVVLDLALAVLTWVRNFLNHLVGNGVSSICEHWSSASWTGVDVHSAALAHEVAHWTRGDRDLSGDEETHGALELL